MFSSSYIIKAIDQFSPIASKVSQGFDKISNKANTAAQSTSKFSKALTTMSKLKALATGTIGYYAFSTLDKFSEQMQGVKAVATQTGVSFKQLEEQAKELGRTTRYTASDAAGAQYFLAKAGYDTKKIYDSMPDTLNLAAAGNLDIAQSADIVTNIMAGYGLKSNELTEAVDILAQSFSSANTDLIELGTAMKYAGPIAKKAKLDFAETTAVLGKLADAGYKGSLGGTTLRQAISKLSKPTKEAQKYMRYYGLQLRQSNGEIKSIIDIVKELEKSSLNTAGYMAIFGQRAGPGMAALVSQGSKSLEELNEKLQNSQGVAKKIADIQMEGLHGTWIKLKSAAEGLVHAIGDAGLTNILVGLGKAVTFLINMFSGFINLVTKGAEIIGGGFSEALVDAYFGVKHLYEAFSEWLSGRLVDTVVFLTEKFKQLYDWILKIIDKIKSFDIIGKAKDKFNDFKGWLGDTFSMNPEVNETKVEQIQTGLNQTMIPKNEIDLKMTVIDKNENIGNIQTSIRGSGDLNMNVGRSSMGF